MESSFKDFFSKYDQICRKLQIWSHLLKKSLMENLIFCVVSSSDYLTNSFTIHEMDDCQYVILKEINIFLSLIICTIVADLINMSTWTKIHIIAYKFKNSFTEKKWPLIQNLRIKFLTCFKHQINIIFLIFSYGSFFY